MSSSSTHKNNTIHKTMRSISTYSKKKNGDKKHKKLYFSFINRDKFFYKSYSEAIKWKQLFVYLYLIHTSIQLKQSTSIRFLFGASHFHVDYRTELRHTKEKFQIKNNENIPHTYKNISIWKWGIFIVLFQCLPDFNHLFCSVFSIQVPRIGINLIESHNLTPYTRTV